MKVAAERDVRARARRVSLSASRKRRGHELRMLVSAGHHPSIIRQHGAFRGTDQGPFQGF